MEHINTINELIYREYASYITNNKNAIQRSTQCSCIGCLKTFSASKIVDYAYPDTTAICPYCVVDVIIPHSLHVPTQNELKKWNKFIFSIVDDPLAQ